MIAQPVGGALLLSLTVLLCAYLLTTLREQGPMTTAPCSTGVPLDAHNSSENAHFFPIRRQLRRGERSPFRVLFTKDLKGVGDAADKGCVSTLAHTMMTAARSADSGLAGPGELDRYPYAEAPGADRVGAPAWDGADPELGRVGRRAAAAAAAACTANSSSSSAR